MKAVKFQWASVVTSVRSWSPKERFIGKSGRRQWLHCLFGNAFLTQQLGIFRCTPLSLFFFFCSHIPCFADTSWKMINSTPSKHANSWQKQSWCCTSGKSLGKILAHSECRKNYELICWCQDATRRRATSKGPAETKKPCPALLLQGVRVLTPHFNFRLCTA